MGMPATHRIRLDTSFLPLLDRVAFSTLALKTETPKFLMNRASWSASTAEGDEKIVAFSILELGTAISPVDMEGFTEADPCGRFLVLELLPSAI